MLATRLKAALSFDTSAWNVASATFNGGASDVFRVFDQESAPNSLFFKPDGTKMYIAGSSGDNVYEYNLSTAWDITSASYLQNLSVIAQDNTSFGLFFKPDGTKMYIAGASGDNVYEYNLSTAWDITSASYLQNFSVAAQDISPFGLFFKPDGTKMYVNGASGDNVYEYNLSTAWDITSASYLQNFSVAAQDGSPNGLFFKPDGTKMYIAGSSGDNVYEYNLSTAWDITSASYLQNLNVIAQDSLPRDIFFKPDGTKMYVVGGSGDQVYEYNLSTAWDITSATITVFEQNYFSLALQVGPVGPRGLHFKPDGTKMYVTDIIAGDVNEYNLSTAWDITSASYLQNLSVIAREINPVGIFFKPDGTKMYVSGYNSDRVNEYNLSTAWDITSASYLQNFSVAAQDTNPYGIFFKPDGTKMYVNGADGDDVNEYNLSTAWDITSASYLQNFSVAAQETIPAGLFFKPDGTKMYTLGSTSDNVNEYNLSTAWDITSASYLQNFYVPAPDTVPTGLFFKPNGTKMYVIGTNSAAIYAYDL